MRFQSQSGYFAALTMVAAGAVLYVLLTGPAMPKASAAMAPRVHTRSVSIGNFGNHAYPVSHGAPLIARAGEAIRSRDYAKAADLYSQALARDPRNEVALVELGILFAHDPRHQKEAQELLYQALGVNPENELALEEVMFVHRESGSTAEGLKFFRQLHAANPGSGIITATYARFLAKDGHRREAIELLDKASKGPATSERALLALVDIYRALGDARHLSKTLSRWILIQETKLNELKKHDRPIELLEIDIVLNKVALADALFESHEIHKAEILLNELLESAPESPPVQSLAIRRQRNPRKPSN